MTTLTVDLRLPALRRFAIAITLLNILGHTLLGFEQSLAQPLLTLIVAYTTDLVLETLDAYAGKRRVQYAGSFKALVDFLLPAHITALAISMLLYANEELWPLAFAAAVAICSKHILRAPVKGKWRHFLNPSNFGITITLLLFPRIGIAQPYMFTENLSGWGDWLLPGVLIMSGSFLNARFTHRIPLILAWLTGFALQALIRIFLADETTVTPFVIMTGVAFLLFTFYMVTDPGTTPQSKHGQITFGLGVALVYSIVTSFHVVFGLFFALTFVSLTRGVCQYCQELVYRLRPERLRMAGASAAETSA